MSCCSDICHASHIIRCKNSRPDFEICQDCIVSTRATAKKTSTLTQFLLGPGHPLYGAVEERLNEKLAPLVGKSSLHVDAAALQTSALDHSMVGCTVGSHYQPRRYCLSLERSFH